ncbi:MAG: SigE family RNA polymerase sigma factor [Pseudonocardiales bacterium]|nr:MAG: SigE family RNA polymerase sigma factor [Pseudonocardiales bacterium]
MSDVRGFDEFYLASRDRLALQVAALTGDPFEALDHVQEAFIRAWTRWDRVSGYDDPEGWVRRVACNRAVSRWRRAHRLVLRPDAGSDVPFEAEQLVVIDALKRLPTREREAIVLHHLVGYSVEEIATRLGAPSGTVKSWLSRGRTRLAGELQAEEEVCDDTR